MGPDFPAESNPKSAVGAARREAFCPACGAVARVVDPQVMGCAIMCDLSTPCAPATRGEVPRAAGPSPSPALSDPGVAAVLRDMQAPPAPAEAGGGAGLSAVEGGADPIAQAARIAFYRGLVTLIDRATVPERKRLLVHLWQSLAASDRVAFMARVDDQGDFWRVRT